MSTASGSPRVLIVEDHVDSRELMALAFRDAGFSVAEAENAGQAVNLLQDEVLPSLILSDLVMPESTGWDLLKLLQEDTRLRRVPVIVVTAVNPATARVTADAVIQKPVDPLELIEMAKRILAVAH
jgi:two-component system, OmpR family, response regulator CpxR